MAANRKSKAAKKQSQTAKAPKQAPAVEAPMQPSNPERAAAWIDRANTYAATKRKPQSLRLSEDQRFHVQNEVEDLGRMLEAVRNLSWMMDSSDSNDSGAAALALEAISELGTFKADAIISDLGGIGGGRYAKEFDRYARARGYTHRHDKAGETNARGGQQ